MIRTLAGALFGLVLCLSPALAQTQVAPGQASEFSQTHLDASRHYVSTLLLDTGVLSEVSLVAFNIVMPTVRQALRTSAFFVSLPPERQQAMFDYLTNSGPVLQEEVLRGAPQLVEQFAPRFAALFSEAELNDITAFMRTAVGGSAFLKYVLAGATRAPPELTAEETSALETFAETPGGIAFGARASELGPLMRELGYTATSAPHVRARLERDMCEIAGPECPDAWRSDL
ncbi:DUF2059 domain-containing protein [Candidatus Viadribacter manganicus]|uniref:Uncharacterized protein n=1 Tax=Candidatus Viadribacter manganicus TaxID=1759059 RepID=A0A1B1AE25_9PROT|nr:DUF2059 domain-containing protein [Candidatus Viadribacter manganicus]ANP44801.1 hypothetical protein ATE48_02105 [Candidatus Viadribacter manganicus]